MVELNASYHFSIDEMLLLQMERLVFGFGNFGRNHV
jgi:hypothetical protein